MSIKPFAYKMIVALLLSVVCMMMSNTVGFSTIVQPFCLMVAVIYGEINSRMWTGYTIHYENIIFLLIISIIIGLYSRSIYVCIALTIALISYYFVKVIVTKHILCRSRFGYGVVFVIIGLFAITHLVGHDAAPNGSYFKDVLPLISVVFAVVVDRIASSISKTMT